MVSNQLNHKAIKDTTGSVTSIYICTALCSQTNSKIFENSKISKNITYGQSLHQHRQFFLQVFVLFAL